ncbi:hypothetical protein ACH79_20330 [Bradyrhizobium sp. CCBAU 051011]|nr:hypothetical protein ACH79_20330 [Bradyrhizobium sp. CCBAU 051011]
MIRLHQLHDQRKARIESYLYLMRQELPLGRRFVGLNRSLGGLILARPKGVEQVVDQAEEVAAFTDFHLDSATQASTLGFES